MPGSTRAPSPPSAASGALSLARFALLHGLFFVSGALGLAYEVLWMRRFTVLFGGAALAVTATLSGFFLGMAAGSLVFGLRSRGWARPLLAFGLLEMGVGAGALLVEPILGLYRVAYPSLYQHLAATPAAFAVVKLLLAFLAVALPTFFMGGSLPVLGEGVAEAGQPLGVPAGGLYAVNVLGAATGALAVPFLLLPRLGVREANLAAVAGSLAVGLAAVALGARLRRPGSVDGRRRRSSAGEPRPRVFVLALAAWSGIVTLGVQVEWTRMFSLVHENSVYSFAVVVVVFLAGLAGGAALARAALGRRWAPGRLLGRAWWVAGTWILLSPVIFDCLTGGLGYLPGDDWGSSLARLLLVALVALLPACLALGMALPLIMELGSGAEDSPGLVLGRLLSVNTAGAIAGPLLVTFLLGPLLGLWTSLALLGGLTVLAANLSGLSRREIGLSWVVVALAVVALRPTGLPPVRLAAESGERLVSVREGSAGTTAVLEDDHDRWITVNNAYVLGGAAAAAEERWQGHLPLLLHPRPRRVAFLGLGTGITAGAALQHPVGRVVALEIVPEVVAAARESFAQLNHHVVTDPRVSVVADDGRNYLAACPPGSFDVVVGDLLVPWRPGESALYTREHFENVRRALASDGIFCQWLPLYQLSRPQLAILVRTFLDVFPRTTLWRGSFLPDAPTLALVGHQDPRPLDAAGIDERVAALAPVVDASSPFLKHPAGLWLHLVGSPAPDAAWLAGARRNTDDEPWVELLSPRGRRTLAGVGLEDLLASVARRPLAGTALSALDPVHREWRDTGMALARAALTPGAEGERHALAILRTLPEPLRRALGVEDAHGGQVLN